MNASRAAEPLRVAVVGGGISGLAVAHALLRRARAADRPLDLRLYEAAQRLGPLAEPLGFSQHVDSSKAARLLGWRPRHAGFVDEVDRLYLAWRAHRDG